MEIRKVELKNGGLKGLVVCYSKERERDGISYVDDYKSVRVKTPVGKGIKDKFRELVPYFSDLLKVGKIQKMEVLSVSSSEKDGFGFKVRVSVDYTTFDVEPQMVDESYPKFWEVMAIVEAINEMTYAHLAGKEKVDARQYMLDLQGSDQKIAKEFADVDFEKMPIGDVKAKMIEALEKTGCIVVDVVDQVNADDEVPVLQMKKTGS
jgi:hypothetical protein